MAESISNRGKFRIANTGAANMTWRATIITGNATGIHDVDLNFLSDLDALNTGATNLHTERLTLASVTVTEDDTNDRVNIDCANLAFAAAVGVSALALVIYHEVSAADTGREIVTVHSTGFPQSMDGGLNVTINDFARLS